MSSARLPQDVHPMVERIGQPRLGSALTPLAREAAWVAYRVASADPSHGSPATAEALTAKLRNFAWGAWLPGRSAIITEIEVAPDRGALDGFDTQVHFAVGCFGTADTTSDELGGFGAGLKTLFDELAPTVTFEPVPPEMVVSAEATESMQDTTLIRPTGVRYINGSQGVDSYGWLQFEVLPWQGALTMATKLASRVRIRATFLATEPSVEDKQEIDRITEQVRDAYLTSGPQRFDPGAVDREIVALESKLSPPVFISELAITSERPLAEPEVRGLAAQFIRHDEARTPSTQPNRFPIASGGVHLLRNPNGHHQALATGVPLYGGLSSRSLLDIVDLTGMPIGLPWPTRTRLQGIPARPNVPDPALRVELDPRTSPARIGTAAGVATGVPEHLRRGHVAVEGAAGSGKTTVLAHLLHHDLSIVRPFLLIDPDGELIEYLRGLPPTLRRRCLIIDPADRSHHHLAFVPKLSPAGKNRQRVLRLASLSADALTRLAPPNLQDDPRFKGLCSAAFELQGATGSDVPELIELVSDPDRLEAVLDEVTLSKGSTRQLSGVVNGGEDHQRYVSTLVALLERLGEPTYRSVLGRPAKALNFESIVGLGPSVALNLSNLSTDDRHLVANVALAHLVDAVTRRPSHFNPYHLYLDDAERLPSNAITDVVRAGPKPKLNATMAATDPTALDVDTAAAFWSSQTWLRLRQTPTASDALATPATPAHLDSAVLGHHQLLYSTAPHRRAIEVRLDARNRREPLTPVAQPVDSGEPADDSAVSTVRRFFPDATLVESSVDTWEG